MSAVTLVVVSGLTALVLPLLAQKTVSQITQRDLGGRSGRSDWWIALLGRVTVSPAMASGVATSLYRLLCDTPV